MAAQPSGKAVPEGPRYLHPAEVADLLHVSPKTVSRWAKEGKLPVSEDPWWPPALPGDRDPPARRRAPGATDGLSLVWYLQDGCARYPGDPDAVLMVDKIRDLKGRPRLGVQRQYTGR